MKVMSWLMMLWWTAVMVFYKCTEADKTCKDSTNYCQRDRCRQPGFSALCRKTCGLCTDSGDTGCPRETWGDICTRNCSMGCVDNICDQETGNCVKGCNPCYEGSLCKSYHSNCMKCNMTSCICKQGFYGTSCISQCSAGCKFQLCENNGVCTRGCAGGWYDLHCDKRCFNCVNIRCSRAAGNCTDGCKTGHYGIKCDKNCNVNCVGNICDQTDGRCHNCSSGQFGDTCDNNCSDKCDTESCDRTDGSCSTCKSGFTGYQCNTECPDQCADQCVQHNGSCLGCKDNYRGSHCNISCPSQCTKCDQYGDRCSSCKTGWFGQTCDSPCENCLGNECSIDGMCRDGCRDGWFGYMCDKVCSCGCKDRHCNGTTGQCTEGCEDGWWSIQSGVSPHELLCDKECSRWCKESRCNTSGFCIGGCQDGRHGETCDESCDAGCKTCDQITKECVTCMAGWGGPYCKELLLHSMKRYVMVLTAAVCVLLVLGIVSIIRRNRLCTCIWRPPDDVYINPIANDVNVHPLRDVHMPRDSGLYASIADDDLPSHGSYT